MTFKKLATYFSQLEKTSSRLRITEILADLLKQADQNETDKVCYLSLGRLGPLYAGIEFNLAEKMMLRVISQAYGISEERVKKEYKQIGDLGEVAEKFDKREKPKPLTVNQVYKRLEQIAQDSGEGSVERKISNLAKLLNDLDAESSKYIVRIPLGRLRLGFSDLTVLDALSWMVAGDKSKRQEIEEAYNNRADVGQIAQIIKSKGLRGLRSLKVQLGVPIMPALCQRLPTAEEMVEKLGKMAVEPKYDGQRLQAHYGIKTRGVYLSHTGCVKIFTRNLENVTHMFPDIVEALGKEVKAKEVILDGEAIGFDPKTGKFLPFQETMKRKRKYEIRRKAKEIPLKFFCFDILFYASKRTTAGSSYKDGRDLLKRPFNKRREILEKVLPSANKTVVLSPQIVTNNPQELRKYHDEQIKKGLEGVVVKKWQAAYDPGRRGYTWVKFKQEKGKKGGGLTDTLDCVVMGYYKGRGKRAKFGIGAFLVGVRRGGEFLTISKIGTGLTDDQWRELKLKIENLKLKIKDKPKEYLVDKNLTPDVWAAPGLVVEIEADNITKSPTHTAKYALRFPRLVQFRDDRSPEDATTLQEAEKLYQLQK